MSRLTVKAVDAVLDPVDDDAADGTCARLLVELLDEYGAWDEYDGGHPHYPDDRIAIVESTGAYWCVYAGTEGPRAWRYGSYDDAARQMDRLCRP